MAIICNVPNREYISALKQCAKEHEKDKLLTGQIRISDLCKETADLLEELEKGIDKILNEMEKYSTSFEHNDRPDLAEVVDYCIGIVESNIGMEQEE